MKTINFEYAVNLRENELKYGVLLERLDKCIIYFTKNTLLQFFCMDLMCEIMDIGIAIRNCERGDYIYNKAIELCAAFDLMQEEYEKSGMSDKLAELASKITSQIK